MQFPSLQQLVWFTPRRVFQFQFLLYRMDQNGTVFLFFHHSGTLLHQLLLKRHFKDLSWHCIQKDILQHLFYRITSTSSLQGGDSWRSFYCKEKITIVENEHFLYPIGLIKVWYVYHCLPTFIVDFHGKCTYGNSPCMHPMGIYSFSPLVSIETPNSEDFLLRSSDSHGGAKTRALGRFLRHRHVKAERKQWKVVKIWHLPLSSWVVKLILYQTLQ